ncbi:MAG: Superfamily II DNA and RNA helicase/Superfamily II DNA or RNA helicase, SNF2 family [Verrucomicrobia bacterium]|jgi:superfamily II DNA or RNA helicase|nr:MAG: Superfamily II DNA and RNA helicase/Superfamily II DNA or RNA helicase, SNF2 family [Verrucomicrobiota bacterium]
MTTPILSKPGTLIHARGREWVVLPDSTPDVLMARPVGGLDEEVTGILPAVESVTSTTFALPTKDDLGDFSSGTLLREAARLSTRAASGPFRCFGRIAAEPRPYQLVPLMMALKLDPVRLLIADDVGIGKTIEAAVIARELLDRGEIRRMAVLCPPHLAEQWQRELLQKFHIEAELVLSSTIQRLERDLPLGVSVFDRHRVTIVSTDFIKSSRRAEDFILKCPEFVIVDEAHGCTLAGGAGRGRQQRFELLHKIAADPSRHILLITATPHSGNEDAFRSLLSLLDAEFADLPPDIDKNEREGIRRKLARHLVQRRRADIRHYLDTDTAFPERLDKESTYTFSKDYRALFDEILEFARDYVAGEDGARRRRVRYWSALALLRCVSSSPAAAAATLRSRAAVDQVEAEDVDEVGRRTVLDQGDDEDTVSLDFSPGSDNGDSADGTRRKLLEFARRAEAVSPAADHKLAGALVEIKKLIKDDFQPVVFCRFVDTAEYVARQLREQLPPKVRVESVTGLLPAAERESRISALVADGGSYVLVCTDCLSEGINLQQHFNAVVHYDLAWNPTRHEQREGRVDRFGQEKAEVRVLTYYGTDNPIDGVILDVLIRKHKKIKGDLGVTVSVPGSSEQIAEALFEAALFREKTGDHPQQMLLDFIDGLAPRKKALHDQWDNARDREKASRSRFAQHTLSPESVMAELQNVRNAIGRSEEVTRFFHEVLQSASVPVQVKGKAVSVHISAESPRALRQAIGQDDPFTGRFDLPLQEGEIYLGRTSPVIEGLASWTLDQALDPVARDTRPVASRSGVISTSAVSLRTNLLIARFRYHLHIGGADAETLLCEEIVPVACTGPADSPLWLPPAESERLLAARPERNLISTAIEQQLGLLLPSLPRLQSSMEPMAQERAAVQLAAHERVREASRTRGRVTIQPVLPVDILGAYVLLPVPA